MGVEVHEIAEGLDRNDCPGSSLLFWREAKEKYLQESQAQRLSSGEVFDHKVSNAEDFGQAEGEVAVGTALRISSQSHSPNSTTRF